MSLIPEQGNQQEFETVPAGVYIARCYRVIDLGTQDVVWDGNTKQQHKVMVSWELLGKPGGQEAPKVTIDEKEQPFTIHKRYTLSLNENANLYKDLVSWRGKPFSTEELQGFNLADIMGKYCQMQVVHKERDGNTYANVGSLMATTEKPDPVNENVTFDLSNPDEKVFESLSDRLQETIKKAPEYLPSKDVNEDAPKQDAPKQDDGTQETDLSSIPF